MMDTFRMKEANICEAPGVQLLLKCRSFRGWKVCKWEDVALHRQITFLAFAIHIFAR